jgi:hypothetical protein
LMLKALGGWLPAARRGVWNSKSVSA